jgi:hypothetical protein
MRVLGSRTSLTVFRWDLVYLLTRLAEDDRPEISTLAGPVAIALGDLRERQGELDWAEDEALAAAARGAPRGRAEAEEKLAAVRAGVERLARAIDLLRCATHEQILVVVKERAAADAFFRPAGLAPAEERTSPPASTGLPAPSTPRAANGAE